MLKTSSLGSLLKAASIRSQNKWSSNLRHCALRDEFLIATRWLVMSRANGISFVGFGVYYARCAEKGQINGRLGSLSQSSLMIMGILVYRCR